jgi:hypothetical protein
VKSELPVPQCFDNPDDATKRLVEMFIEMGQAKRTRINPADPTRAVFRKVHGVAQGRLVRAENLPEQYHIGFLAKPSLEAWMRFSSDAAPADADLGTTLGVGIKLFGVPGPKALGEDGNTSDLILQNAKRFFVDNAKEMVEFTYAGVVQRNYDAYLATHPVTNEILNEMTAPRGSVLTSTYWALLPFHLGSEIIKYRLSPETAPEDIADDAADYLATDITNRLAEREYRFRLEVMFRTDPASMPLDEATKEWPEAADSWRTVATLVLPQQDITAPGQCDYGQNLSFNIWRALPDNAPCSQSSIAVVRREVYKAGATLRHRANGNLTEDPREPRMVAAAPEEPDSCIVQAVIHPAIGIARVGSSDAYFYGPEVTDPPSAPEGFYRDEHKRLKRQAARFRIYGANARGEIIRELTGSSDIRIDWNVSLANTKAAWFGFQLALDVPEANYAPPTTLRNPGIADRSRLAITPPPVSLSGPATGPETFEGIFMDLPVYLGEAFTDSDQRLTVLGGKGVSRSFDNSPAITFANNEGWHDDVGDGPVTARVWLNGEEIQVTPAWVVVAPPNYGPQRKSVRTMYDLMRDVAITAGMLPPAGRPSFTRDILPIFERMAGLQWVNAGFAGGFGWNGAFDLTSPAAVARLGSNSPAMREQRRIIYNNFRDFGRDGNSPIPWPWLYGDAMNIPPAPTPRQNSTLAACQMWALEQWAEGNFDADYGTLPATPKSIDEVPVAEQGDMLTRSALEFCLADAFHPGCEMTWPVRAASMYMEPFRFLHTPKGWVEPVNSQVLTPDSVTIPMGPLFGQSPGSITRWMAVPWQTDTSSCRSGYTPNYDPYAPSFWPARVPNEVLTEENYRIVMDRTRPLSERQKAFASREAWIEPLGADGYTHQINNMIQHFDFLAVVEQREGPGDADFPAVIEVGDWTKLITPEEERYTIKSSAAAATPAHGASGANLRGTRSAREVDLSSIELVNRFPNGLPPQSR